MLTLTMAAGGWIGNLIVYLITKYNVKSIDATQIFNVVVGCMSLFPIAAAILSDSFYGSFAVITVFSFVSLLGITLMTLTASFPSLRPAPCTNKLPCKSPSKLQYGVIYTILGLACIGLGGTRFTLATMGADQFEDSESVGVYFNWYFFVFYAANVISTTAIIYVQDNVSWTVGFGICVICNAVGVILFLSGKNFYRKIKPNGSPFTSIARVVVAAVRKRKVSSANQEYNYDINDKSTTVVPSDSFRFLNHGAKKIESDGSKTRSWSLSSVQEVEDLKTLIKIMPLWSSSVMLSCLVGMFNNFTILQALSMDRHLGGSNFKIPASSFLSLDTLATSITISILDRLIFPTWQKLTSRSVTPLQRIGLGHVLNLVGLTASALVEVRRLHTARDHHLIGSSMGATTIVPISALWLLVPLTVMGISQAFLFPGQISLYYQEFPTSLRSTSTAMISLLVAIGFYLCTAITGLIRNSTGWLKDDLNDGRLDLVYWLLAAIGVVNFGYFIVCAKMFQHKLDK